MPQWEILGWHETAAQMLESLNAAARRAQNSWLFFLGVTAFLFITVSSVTHATLLLDVPVRLPLFQVEMRVYSFFMVAPALYLLIHIGVLIQHRLLREKARAFGKVLRGAANESWLRNQLSIYAYLQHLAGPHQRGALAHVVGLLSWLTLAAMPLLLLAYFQASFLPYHSEAVTWANRLIITADVLTIWWSGVFALPFSFRCIKKRWARRAVKEPLAHVVKPRWRYWLERFVLWLRRTLRAFGLSLRRHPRQLLRRWQQPKKVLASLNAIYSLLALIAAWMVMTVPDGRLDRLMCAGQLKDVWCIGVPRRVTEKASTKEEEAKKELSGWFVTPARAWDLGNASDGTCDKTIFDLAWTFGFDLGGEGGEGSDSGCCCGGDSGRQAFFLTAIIFERGANHVTNLSNGFLGLGRNLIVTNTDFSQYAGKGRRISLRGRNLAYGVFDHIVLPDTDFTGADLSQASFKGADLHGAIFGCANTGRAKRKSKEDLPEDVIRCTNLHSANFQNANLDYALFQGKEYESVSLTGDGDEGGYISFGKSSLNGAKFKRIKLQNADFSEISAMDVEFDDSILKGASFDNSDLTGAAFNGGDLTGASFKEAILMGTRFENVSLDLVDFEEAWLDGADFSKVSSMKLVNFHGAWVWKTTLPEAAFAKPESLEEMFRFALFDGLNIKRPEKEVIDEQKHDIAAIEKKEVRKRLRDRLKPLLTGEEWKDDDKHRRMWAFLAGETNDAENEKAICPISSDCDWLAQAQSRTRWIIENFCSGQGEKDGEKNKEFLGNVVSRFTLSDLFIFKINQGSPRTEDKDETKEISAKETKDSYLLSRIANAEQKKLIQFNRSDLPSDRKCSYPYLIDLDMLVSACKLDMNIYKDDVEAFKKWKSKRFAKCVKQGTNRKMP